MTDMAEMAEIADTWHVTQSVHINLDKFLPHSTNAKASTHFALQDPALCYFLQVVWQGHRHQAKELLAATVGQIRAALVVLLSTCILLQCR